jgi:hypothetical protein
MRTFLQANMPDLTGRFFIPLMGDLNFLSAPENASWFGATEGQIMPAIALLRSEFRGPGMVVEAIGKTTRSASLG